MLKVVFDTNIIISAFNFGGKPAEVVKPIPVNEIKKNFLNYLIICYSIFYHR